MLALDQYSQDLMELERDEGVKVHRTSKDILKGQIESWDKIIAELEQDPFMKRILDSQRAWVERVGYFEIMAGTDVVTAYEHFFPGKLNM
jgi:TRAP-type mannitol/chloroaromatic compound transport system substrate-binding protein